MQSSSVLYSKLFLIVKVTRLCSFRTNQHAWLIILPSNLCVRDIRTYALTDLLDEEPGERENTHR